MKLIKPANRPRGKRTANTTASTCNWVAQRGGKPKILSQGMLKTDARAESFRRLMLLAKAHADLDFDSTRCKELDEIFAGIKSREAWRALYLATIEEIVFKNRKGL